MSTTAVPKYSTREKTRKSSISVKSPPTRAFDMNKKNEQTSEESSVDIQIKKLLTKLSEKGKRYIDDSEPGLFRKIAWAGSKGKSVIFIPADDSKINLSRFHDGIQDSVGDFTKKDFAKLDLKALLF